MTLQKKFKMWLKTNSLLTVDIIFHRRLFHFMMRFIAHRLLITVYEFSNLLRATINTRHERDNRTVASIHVEIRFVPYHTFIGLVMAARRLNIICNRQL